MHLSLLMNNHMNRQTVLSFCCSLALLFDRQVSDVHLNLKAPDFVSNEVDDQNGFALMVVLPLALDKFTFRSKQVHSHEIFQNVLSDIDKSCSLYI